ncbi:MAG: peptidoglycan DD-metalloendopeptidase family protein, partial [Longimicrobiales bacterium]
MTGASVPTGRPRDPRDGTRILLVEKRGSLRRLLRRVLEDAGHDVLTATDIQAGLSRLARSDDPVDVLVADAADTGSFGAAGPLDAGALGELQWPVEGEILYRFGPERRPNGVTLRRNGIGIAAPAGTPVRSVRSGVVVVAEPMEGFGPGVVLSHGKGYY